MATLLSRVTARYRATLPRAVRQALGIRPGDLIAFAIEKGGARIRRATTTDIACTRAPAATLTEWDSKADDEAYRDL